MFFGEGRAGSRRQRLTAEEQDVCPGFDHLLNGHHRLLRIRAGVGLYHPHFVPVDPSPGVGFLNQLFDGGEGGVERLHVAGLGDCGSDNYLLGKAAGGRLGRAATAAATGQDGQCERQQGEKRLRRETPNFQLTRPRANNLNEIT